MIDDKKIDIAARAQAFSKHINETAYFQIRSIEDFKDGARWAINEFLKDLWHTVDEEPKLGKRVLVKINGNLSLFNSGFVVEHLRNFDDHYGIESWLYIDDLFPKEGGKQRKNLKLEKE